MYSSWLSTRLYVYSGFYVHIKYQMSTYVVDSVMTCFFKRTFYYFLFVIKYLLKYNIKH